MDNQKIGNYIAGLRKGNGLTQQQLADRLGITNKAVSKWETGEGLPDISVLPALAEVLGTTTDAILSGGQLQTTAGEAGAEGLGAAAGASATAGGPAAAKYLLEQALKTFRTATWISFGLLLIGLVTTVAIWLERQNFYAVAIGMVIQICGWVVFEIALGNANQEIANFNRLGFEPQVAIIKRGKYYALGIWLVAVIPLNAVISYGTKYMPFAYSTLALKGVELSFYLFLCAIGAYLFYRRR